MERIFLDYREDYKEWKRELREIDKRNFCRDMELREDVRVNLVRMGLLRRKE